MRYSSNIYPYTIARCEHIKVNGIQCGSPALKDRKFCFFHQRWHQKRLQIGANQARRARFIDLPVLEDANAIQVALMQGLRLLLTNQIDHRTASLLFYALQTASSNLSRTRFEPLPTQVVIDPAGVADTNLGDQAWYREEFEQEEQSDDAAADAESRDAACRVSAQEKKDAAGENAPAGTSRNTIDRIEAVASRQLCSNFATISFLRVRSKRRMCTRSSTSLSAESRAGTSVSVERW